MSSKELIALILNDHYRVYKNKRKISVLKHLFIAESFKYIFWMRVCSYFKSKKIKTPYYCCKLI
ncbi:hypothetical protein, partial [Aliivibrio kagoshimensis]|uniref:hypothetical protein n=1 Tax=Aliivibrio kagoshimensis TaxID=2910230 RepID=UPI003D101B8B